MAERSVVWSAVAKFSQARREADKTAMSFRNLAAAEDEASVSSKANAAQADASAKKAAKAALDRQKAARTEKTATESLVGSVQKLSSARKQSDATTKRQVASAETLAKARLDERAANGLVERSLFRLGQAQAKLSQLEKSGKKDTDAHTSALHKVEAAAVAAERAKIRYASATEKVRKAESEAARASEGSGRGFRDIARDMGRAERSSKKLGFSLRAMRLPLIGAAIAFLVPLISQLVGALGALVGAISPAVGALATIPQAALGAATAIGTLIGAFKGIGGALSAYSKQQKAASATGASAAKAQADQAKQVERAQQALADARENAARAAVDAAKNVADAEKSLADAQNNSDRAQKNLNDARDEAIKQLQEYENAVRDAGFSEEEAAISLARAQQELAKVNSNPMASSLDRREAELNYREAEARLSDAKKAKQDAAKENADAQKKGIEGSDVVQQAYQDQIDAIDGVAEAQQNLKDAQDAQSKTMRDNARAIRDASDSLKSAMQDQAAGLNGGAAAADAYQEALNALTPAGRRFVKFLISLKPKLDQLKRAAAGGILPGAEKGIRSLLPLFPLLLGTVRRTSAIIGKGFEDLGKRLGTPELQGIFQRLFGSNEKILTSLISSLNTIVISLLRMADAARPLTEWMGQLIAQFAAWTDKSTKGTEAAQKMATFFDHTRESLSLLGNILKNMTTGFIGIGKAGREFGNEMLGSFNDVLKKWSEWTNSTKGQNEIKKYFDDIKPGVYAIFRFVRELSNAFLRLGRNKGLADTVDQITAKVIPAVERLVGALSGDFGEALINMITNIIDALNSLASSGAGGALTTMAQTLGAFAKGLAAVVKIPGVGAVIGGIVSAFAAFKAIKLVGTITGVSKLYRTLKKFRELKEAGKLAKYGEGIAKFGKALGTFFTGPVGLIILAIGLIIAGLVLLFKKNKTFHDFVIRTWENIKKIVTNVWENYLLPAFKAIGEWITGTLVPAIKALWENGVKPVFNAIGKIAVWLWKNVLSKIFQGWVLYVTKFLIPIITFLWKNVIKPYFTLIGKSIAFVWKAVIWPALKAFWWYISKVLWPIIQWLWQKVVRPVFSAIGLAIKTAWNSVIKPIFDKFKAGLTALGDTFKAVKRAIATVWNNLTDAVSGPIKSALNWITVHFIDPIQKLLDKIGLKIKLPRVYFGGESGSRKTSGGGVPLASGGEVPGHSPHDRADNIPARLTAGEYVLPVRAVKRLKASGGSGLLENLRRGFYGSGGEVNDNLNGSNNSVVDKIKSVVDPFGIAGVISKVVNGIKSIGSTLSDNIFTSSIGKIASLAKNGIETKIREFVSNMFSSKGFARSNQHFSGNASQWTATILQALAWVGQPASLLSVVINRMNQESGGNPRAINLWDINAKNGVPSKGLMQVIDPTFAAYRDKRLSGDIYDPLANIVASMRYAIARYGSLIAAYTRAGGYATGGQIPGSGNGDTVPAMLTPGEFVIRKKAAKKIGLARLQQLNNADRAPGTQYFHTGGEVLGMGPGASGKWVKGLRRLMYQDSFSQTWTPDLTDAMRKIPASSHWPKFGGDADWLHKIHLWMSKYRIYSYADLYNIPLRLGSNGYAVKRLQTALGGLSKTGKFDSRTLARVKAYQKSLGLPQNGVVNKDFWKALEGRRNPDIYKLFDYVGNGFDMQQLIRMWSVYNPLMSKYMKWYPKAGNYLLSKINIGKGERKSDLLALEQALGFGPEGTLADGYVNRDADAEAINHMIAHALGMPHDKFAIRPWSPLTDVEHATQAQENANALQREFNGYLDTLSGWGFSDLVDRLLEQGIDEGLSLARLAAANKDQARDYNDSIKQSKSLTENQVDDTKFIGLFMNSPEDPGIRYMARAMGIPDYSVVQIFERLTANGRLPSSSLRGTRLRNESALFKSGLFYAATGGRVPGSGNKDTVPAMLTPGEFVLRKSAVRALGLDNLKRLNQAQYFAGGGPVYSPATASREKIANGAFVKSSVSDGIFGSAKTVNFKTIINYPKAERSTTAVNRALRRKVSTGQFGPAVIGNDVTEEK